MEGPIRLPPLKNNVVVPIDEIIENKPTLSHKTDGDNDGASTDRKTKSNVKADDEVLIGTPDLFFASGRNSHNTEESRKRKGFDSKTKKSAMPNSAAMDRQRFSGTNKESLGDSTLTNENSFVKRQLLSMLSPTDNRLSLKLFGSRKGIKEEAKRLQQAGHLIIHPCSKFRFYWDLVMLCLILFNIVCLPVVITYFKYDELSVTWTVINCVMDTLFIMDVVFNFRTGFMDNGSTEQVILNPQKIARHYIMSWFFVDFIASIPMDYIFLFLGDNTSGTDATKIIEVSRALKILRFAKLLSLVRLLRLSRLMRFVGQYEQIFNVASAVVSIFNLVMIMLLICHWNGCLQFLVPVIQEYPSYSWVAINRLQNANWWEQYTWSLFKAMSHMLCIGYGRFPPQCTTDVWLTMVSMVSGATCFALFISHATNLIQCLDSSSRQYREKVKQVEEYMSYNKLPKETRLKVLDYYEHRYHGKMFDESQIFAEVSQNLLEEIANYNCRDLVSSVPFFRNTDPTFVTRVVSLLKFELFQPGDYIIQEGTFGDRMFFIQSGIVDVLTASGAHQTSLTDGSYFGEICLMTKHRRTASVRAACYCCLYSLSVDKFRHILAEYPSMKNTMIEVAKARLFRLGREEEIQKLNQEMARMEKDAKADMLFPIPSNIPSRVVRLAEFKDSTNMVAEIHQQDNKHTTDSEHLTRIINIKDGLASGTSSESDVQK